MRRYFFLCALAYLVTTSLCQELGDDDVSKLIKDIVSKTTTAAADDSDENLNLDPDVIDDKLSTRNDNDQSEATECTTTTGERGLCVTYYLCEHESKTIIKDGFTIMDVRAADDCPNVLDACCLPQEVVAEPGKRPVEGTETVTEVVSVDSTADEVGSCGYSSPGVNVFSERIGGDNSERPYADFGEFPWMVAILKTEDEKYIGGGSLIHPSVVMTAVHKLMIRRKTMTAAQVKIRAGDWETNSENELYDYQDRNVKKFIPHENFFRPSVYNDVALLILESPVKLKDAPNIGMGCLATQPPPANAICYSMGWGADNFKNKNVYASILKKVKLPLVEKNRCEELLRKTRLGMFFQLHSSLFCAGGEEGVDTCRGDGGSSLVCTLDSKGSRFAIYGMVAYGLGCGVKDVPAVYVNVPDLYNWIEQKFKEEGLNSTTYKYA